MRARFSKINLTLVTTLGFLFATQGCELLQKRDITPTESTQDKEARNFTLLSYLAIEEFAVSETFDPAPDRNLRNSMSSINAMMLVASKTSSFAPWHKPAPGCLAINDTGLHVQRLRLNIDMGSIFIKVESVDAGAELKPQQTSNGAAYGAWVWLPPSTYTFEAAGNPALAWKQTGVTSLAPGSNIKFWSNGSWRYSSSPDLNLSESYVIKTSEDFRAGYINPLSSDFTQLTITDKSNNFVTCYGETDSEIVVPKELLSQLVAGGSARIDLKFMSTRLDTTHDKINEIYIQSASRHAFGHVPVTSEQSLELGTVTIAR